MHRTSIAGFVVALGLLLTALPASSQTPSSPAGVAPAPPSDLSASKVASNVVAARFLVDVDGLESGFPDDQKAGGLIPMALRARDDARLVRSAVQTLRTPDGTPVKVAFDSLFAIVADEFRALDLHVHPADTLRGTVPYLLGFPMGSASSIVSSGLHARAIDVEIDVTVPDQGTGYWAVVGTGRSKTKGRPELYLRVRYVDADGVTWREKVRVRSKERVELSERWLLGVQREGDVSDASSLFSLTREAARRVVDKRSPAL